MKKGKMPPALARYWRTHKRPGSKVRTKRRRSSGHTAHPHRVHHRKAHCSHGNARAISAPGLRGVKWCGDCGALCDGDRWHRPHR